MFYPFVLASRLERGHEIVRQAGRRGEPRHGKLGKFGARPTTPGPGLLPLDRHTTTTSAMLTRLSFSHLQGFYMARVKVPPILSCAVTRRSLPSQTPSLSSHYLSRLSPARPRPQTTRQRFPGVTMHSPSKRHYSAASPPTTAATRKPPSPVRPSSRSVFTTQQPPESS